MSEAVMWDQIAANYDNEVFDVYKNDKLKKVSHYVRKHSNEKNTAIDFGCGTGKALPLLTPLFKKIIAVDISQNCIDRAKEKYSGNITFKQADLGSDEIDLPKVDFVFCCNVAIAKNITKNYKILTNAMNTLKKGGHAVFVLPSLESASYARQQLFNWYMKDGTKLSEIPKEEIAHLQNIDPRQPLKGFIKLSDTENKHYLFNELYSLFNSDKNSVESIDRVEYDWHTEFNSPPKWMTAPYPWDWLVEVKRIN